jgi:hypothetical protein
MICSYLPLQDWLRVYTLLYCNDDGLSYFASIRISTLYPTALDTKWLIESDAVPIPTSMTTPTYPGTAGQRYAHQCQQYQQSMLNIYMISSSTEMMSQSAYPWSLSSLHDENERRKDEDKSRVSIPSSSSPSSPSSSLSMNEAHIVICDNLTRTMLRYSVHQHRWLPLLTPRSNEKWSLGYLQGGYVVAVHHHYFYFHSKFPSGQYIHTHTHLKR